MKGARINGFAESEHHLLDVDAGRSILEMLDQHPMLNRGERITRVRVRHSDRHRLKSMVPPSLFTDAQGGEKEIMAGLK